LSPVRLPVPPLQLDNVEGSDGHDYSKHVPLLGRVGLDFFADMKG